MGGAHGRGYPRNPNPVRAEPITQHWYINGTYINAIDQKDTYRCTSTTHLFFKNEFLLLYDKISFADLRFPFSSIVVFLIFHLNLISISPTLVTVNKIDTQTLLHFNHIINKLHIYWP